MYMVQKATERFKGNRVTLVFDGEGGPVCICTCAFPARYKIPCRHVFAAAQGGFIGAWHLIHDRPVAYVLPESGFGVSELERRLFKRHGEHGLSIVGRILRGDFNPSYRFIKRVLLSSGCWCMYPSRVFSMVCRIF